MKLTVKIKLLTDAEQHEALVKTMELFNEACDYISNVAFETKKFSQVPLHRMSYHDARKKFPELAAQFIVRAIAVVAGSYLNDKRVIHKFKKHSAVVYDERILSFKRLNAVSINSVSGRLKIPFIVGRYYTLEGKRLSGQADLTLENNVFFLNVVVDILNATPFDPKDVIGVDKGIVNIATTSDGVNFSGEAIDDIRIKMTNLKAALQKKGTKSAKRHLKKTAKRQSGFQKNYNHIISKQIVSIAKGTGRAIALEDLTSIRDRQTVRRSQRGRFGNWAFNQLDGFIEYKAVLAGVPVIFVNPRNTSRECPVCHNISKSNRKSQSDFSCVNCGYEDNADFVGAVNIRFKGLKHVNQPIAVHPCMPSSFGTASRPL